MTHVFFATLSPPGLAQPVQYAHSVPRVGETVFLKTMVLGMKRFKVESVEWSQPRWPFQAIEAEIQLFGPI